MSQNVKFHALIYAFSNVLSSALPVIILPYLSNHLSVEEYGVLTNFSLIVLFLGFFIGLQTASFLQRQYFVVDRLRFGEYFFNILIIALITLLPLLVIYPFSTDITEVLFSGQDFFWQIFGIGLSNYFITLLAVQKQMEQKPRFVLTLRLVQCFVELLLTYLFIENIVNSLDARIMAMWISNSLIGLFSVWYIVRKYLTVFKINIEFLRESIVFGLPVFFNVIFGWIMTSSGRFFLSYYDNLHVVGAFSFSFQMAMVISLVGNSINQAWTPWLYQRLADSSPIAVASLRKGVLYCISAIVIATLAFIILVPFCVPLLFNAEFELDMIIFSLIAIGFSLNTCYRILVNFMFFEKRTKAISLITMFCAVISIVLNWLLVPYLGSLGAAVSSFFSFGFGFLIICIIVKKREYLIRGVSIDEK